MKLRTSLLSTLAALAATLHAEPLKIGYSDWPGFTILEVAKQKGWFKEAGVDVDLVWFDYLPSLDAFSAGKIDARHACVATDALVNGANGAKSKIICAARLQRRQRHDHRRAGRRIDQGSERARRSASK